MSQQGIELTVLSHPECDSDVLEESDIIEVGETLIKNALELSANGKKDIMLITECGTAERIMAESENELNLIGACVMCKHMKKTQLEDILQALKHPKPEQIIQIDPDIINKARISLDEMFKLAE